MFNRYEQRYFIKIQVDIRRAIDRSVREISRNDVADGVGHLLRICQHIVDLAGDYI